MALGKKLKEAAHLQKLKANDSRRGVAAKELEDARRELGKLIQQGRDMGIPMVRLCEAAGVNRERGYDLLRDADRRPRELYHQEGR